MADITNAKELRLRTDEELDQFVIDKQDELLRLRFQFATGQLENVRRVKQVQREVARARTIQGERTNTQAEG